MHKLPGQVSTLYNAVTLAERIASLHTTSIDAIKEKPKTGLGRRRLERWAAQPPFDADGLFTRRLALDGVSEEEIEFFLEESPESIASRFQSPPAWLLELEAAYNEQAALTEYDSQIRSSLQTVEGFVKLIEPLVAKGLTRFKTGIKAISYKGADPPFDKESIERLFIPQLFTDLIMVISRTLILELNVARLQGVLHGATAEERFSSFVERLSRPGIAFALLEEYPVLARQVVIRINNWVNFSLEFLNHLCADWELIWPTFGQDGDLGMLKEVKSGAGDLHHGGRAVIVAGFNSGRRIVYKPRSLAIDIHFQKLLLWLNERGDHPPFRALKVIDREDHGWVEFVERQECTSAEEIERFYRRQGAFVALLYALQAVDFHYENLIAAGEHPVLIDLESLFHPRPRAFEPKNAVELAACIIDRSVLRTSLLPRRIWMGKETDGIDLSGLGAAGGQVSPFDAVYWEKIGTDEMHVARKRGKMPEGQNQPSIKGGKIDLLDYGDAIAAGFISLYRTLVTHRDELLSDNGPLSKFSNDQVRVILRPTTTYAELLSESFHPDLLRNALDRDRFFDRLWREADKEPHLLKVIRAERDDLHSGDVPMFTTRAASRDLWSGSGERVAEVFDESGLEMARRRIGDLGDEDLAQQLWFIRGSLTSLAMGTHDSSPGFSSTAAAAATTAKPGQLLEAATAIGDRLQSLAIRCDHDAIWIGLTAVNERTWSLLPLGIDLYGGLSGVALFLAYLGSVTGEERYGLLARSALVTVEHEVASNNAMYKSVGGFSGLGGVVYAMTHIGRLMNLPSLLDEADALIELLPPLIDEDELLDIIGGTAGCLASLIAFYDCTSSGKALDVARKCGDRLIAKAVRTETGVGWKSSSSQKRPLTGFSHGAAGIAWALFALAQRTGERRFQDAGWEAIAYERSLFVPGVDNWPDLREPETEGIETTAAEPGYSTTWCHGAPGIGLSRICLLGNGDDNAVRLELDAAVRTTLSQGFGYNHSLCHGDLGNLELLLQASRALDDPTLNSELWRITSGVLEGVNRYGWLCGVPMQVETPGLMCGLAGIGYGLLRIAYPERIPSVLTLEPPHQTVGPPVK